MVVLHRLPNKLPNVQNTELNYMYVRVCLLQVHVHAHETYHKSENVRS